MNIFKSKGFWALTGTFLVLGTFSFLSYEFYFQFYKSTTDAYVSGNLIPLNTQINGFVKSIFVDETQHVDEGQLLVELDDTDARVRLEKQKAHLASTVRKIVSLVSEIQEAEAMLDAKKATTQRTRYDLTNRAQVVDIGGVSKEDFEHAQTAFTFASADMLAQKFKLLALKARLQNSTPENHPDVEMAKSELKEAYIQFQRCRIYAPYEGIITQRVVQVGNTVEANSTLLSMVPLNQIWINANFKETQIKKIRIGQRVEIYADMWGHKTPFHGKVVGHNPGTGAVFSILPPQNATGNWIKIVQRVPIRISLDPKEVLERPLWLGLSTKVRVDVHDDTLPLISTVSALTRPFETTLFDHQLDGAFQLIESIVQNNMQNND